MSKYRKVYHYSQEGATGVWSSKVYYSNEHGEYEVRFYDRGEIMGSATYHTNDKQDAIDTAKAEVARLVERDRPELKVYEYTGEFNAVLRRARVYYTSGGREYVAKFYLGSSLIEGANYYTTDKQDAIDTAIVEVQRMTEQARQAYIAANPLRYTLVTYR